MTDTRLKPNKCPTCGRILDATTSVQGEQTPSPNDISICMYCAALLIFNDDMTLRKCPYHIIETFPPDIILKIAKATVLILMTKKPSP